MGGLTSIFYGSSNENVIDPATGLTGRQKKLVQSTWSVVRKEPIANGVAIMITFFKKHPEYQKLFGAFKDLPVDELAANKKFQAHCLSIITALNNVVDSMGDPALLEANLLAIGERHHRRGNTREQFLHLKEVILEVLRQKFGTKFTPETAEAWNKTLDAVYSIIFQAFTT
ncbi:globin [Trichogramma pretiosum]|uniref:Globin domain-containing protein n=1 Tax=Trichogramma kaykai TaxID=54128 RepID=A0ABD2X9R4_9HYME|nr:globin [Trichogramma pretiosum]XP_014236593.1 globin [Trichogramma pretiosum]